MMIVERVERHAACPANAHEPSRAKQPELVRDGRLRHPHQGREVADASFAVRQGIDEPYTRRIAEQFEDLSDRFDGSTAQQPVLNVREGCGVGAVRFGAAIGVGQRFDWGSRGSHKL